MSTTAGVLLVIAAVLVLIGGVFAALDAALQRLSKARIDEMRRDGVKGAEALVQIMTERSRQIGRAHV